MLDMNTHKLDPLRHYYLYAKGHYVRSEDIFEDLKRIHSQWTGVDPEYLSNEHVIVKLCELAYVHIIKCKDATKFIEFVSDIHPGNAWKIGAKPDRGLTCGIWHVVTSEDYYLRVARKCLSILMSTGPKDFPFNLGEPDGNLLKLTKDQNNGGEE